jgi:outer membrane protein
MRLQVKRWISLTLLVATLGLTGTALADKIGVVDLQRLFAEAPQARAAQQALENEFVPRQKAFEAQKKDFDTRVKNFERDKATMSEADLTKAQRDLRDLQLALERRGKEFQEDAQVRQNEEMQKVQRAIYEAVRGFGKAQGYDLVLTTQGAIYNNDSLDITNQVLQALQASKPAAAPAAPAKK